MNKLVLAHLKIMLPTIYSLTNHIYDINKQDLTFNNSHGLICYKTQPNQTKPILCIAYR